MIILRNLTYIHPDRSLLFNSVDLTVHPNQKLSLVGNNGVGKSTLLRMIAGDLQPTSGEISTAEKVYYVPQIYGQYNHLTIAQALRVEGKLTALKEITEGSFTEENIEVLSDDWTIEERCIAALEYWQLGKIDLFRKLGDLSGGQKTKVFLAGILINQPQLILLDEPGNHLDNAGRQLLRSLITSSRATIVMVSHDRKLLNLADTTAELTRSGIKLYGGNYEFYSLQKQIEMQALSDEVKTKEKSLKKAKDKERETTERQQKLDARGKHKQEKAGVARIMMNTLRNSAENSTARLKNSHAEKIEIIAEELQTLRSEIPDIGKMKFGFDNSGLHNGKILFSAAGINFGYHANLWNNDLDIEIRSGERIELKGANGSGKTTLVKIILGELEPTVGSAYRNHNKPVYIDQEYSLIDNTLTVYQQAQLYNNSGLLEHEIKIRLTWFLFLKEDWNKQCSALSGGEKMRLMLCCLTISTESPDIIILDEPTNNLDIRNIEILTAAITRYKGTIIAVSHDEWFIEQINPERVLMV